MGSKKKKDARSSALSEVDRLVKMGLEAQERGEARALRTPAADREVLRRSPTAISFMKQGAQILAVGGIGCWGLALGGSVFEWDWIQRGFAMSVGVNLWLVGFVVKRVVEEVTRDES